MDFVLAFPPVDPEEYIWMQLTIGFQADGETEEDSDRNYVLKLNKNIYGLKQGSYNWYKKLKELLVDREFTTSDIHTCSYIVNVMIVSTCVDNCIIV